MQTARDLIEQYYLYFNEKNMSAFFNLLSDDVIHDINQGKREIGKIAFKLFMDRMNQSYQEKIKHIVIMANEEATHAAAEFIVEGIYLATDSGLPLAKKQHYTLAGGAFFEIKENKIIRITNYYNLQEWLEQIQEKT